MNVRACVLDDVNALARMNHMLIEDEKASNPMSLGQLEERMVDFLRTDYEAFFLETDGSIVGYALVNMKSSPLYLRQFFICREQRRKGYGKAAFHALLAHLRVDKVDIDVYAWNDAGIAFWKSLGFTERVYSMRFQN